MKRNQFIFLTGGLLLLGCTQNKVDLPATPPKPAAATPAPQAAPAGDAQAAPAPVPAATASAPAGAQAPAGAAAPVGSATPDGNVNTRLSGEVASQTKSQLSFRVGGFIQDLKVKTGMAKSQLRRQGFG
jgi:hypothetical protein